MIQDGYEVDLSEQWLVSCTDAGSCSGGFHGPAFDYFLWNIDPCGGYGAVLEADFPYAYVGGVEYPDYIEPCGCPYVHYYRINSWGFVAANTYRFITPSVLAIKQAILDYGPVAVSMYVDETFQAYTGGVYENPLNYSGSNHAVVLVGWDDSQGENGVWFLKNSWGTGWGENGYMRIGYSSNNVGYHAAYLDYSGRGLTNLRVVPMSGFYSLMEKGGPVFPDTRTYMLINNGITPLQWAATSSQPWIDIIPSEGVIPGNARRPVQVTINQEAMSLGVGEYVDTVVIADLSTGGAVFEREISLKVVEQRPAAIMTIIEPQEAAELGAQWRIANVEGATWQNSGEIITGVYPDDYELEFDDVAGWYSPLQVRITKEEMVSQQITVVRAYYTPETAGTFTAIAGADQYVPADNATAILNGKASGGLRPYVFAWSVISRPPGSLPVTFAKITSQNAYPAYLATMGGEPARAGDYVLKLTVTDARGVVETDTMTVTVVDGGFTGDQTADATPGSLTGGTAGGERPVQGDTPDSEQSLPEARPCGAGGTQSLAMTFTGLLLILFISRRRLL